MSQALCLLHANCQGDALRPLLENTPTFARHFRIRQYVNYTRQSIAEADLEQCALFLYQRLAPRWGALSTEQMLPRLPAFCRCVEIPNLFFKGYWPFWTNAVQNIDFADSLLERLLAQGLAPEEALNLYLRGDPALLGDVAAVAEDSLAREEEKEAEKKEAPALLSFIRKPEMLLIQLGIVGLFALVVESAMFDWSGLYFESVLQVPKSLQIGFLVFMVMMTVGRFLTNSAYSVLGKQKVLQLAGFFIFAGFFISAMLGGMFESMTVKVIVNSLGFMLVGLGISCMVPTIYSLVGAKSKTPVGIALTILSSISFIGSLIAPLLIGAISQAFNMKYAYIVVGLLGLCILLMTTFCKAFKNN